MVILGLLLVVVAGVAAVGLALVPGSTAEVEFFGLHLPNLPARSLVLLGVVIGIVFMLGLSMVRWGFAAAGRRRRARKEQKTALVSAEQDAAEARRQEAEAKRVADARAEEARAERARREDVAPASARGNYPDDSESPTAEIHTGPRPPAHTVPSSHYPPSNN